MRCALVTDSSVDGPADFFGDLSALVTEVPLLRLGEGPTAKTARPGPEFFVAQYLRLADAGFEAIVSIHLSGLLSGTVDSARMAAADPRVAHRIPVLVVDSGTLGMALGFAVRAGARCAAQGADAEAVAERARATARGSAAAFVVDDLSALRRGGRLTALQYAVGSALAIKPMLAVVDGALEVIGKARTAARADGGLIRWFVANHEDVARHDIGVHHLDATERAQRLAQSLAELADRSVADIPIGAIGPVLATHAGSGLVAVVSAPRP